MKVHVLFLLAFICLLSACWKEETVVIPNNEPPIVNNVPTIKIKNYVNRLFIDLLGREPLDSEIDAEVQALRDADLVESARESLIVKLQTSTDFIEGDTSYQRAYYQHLYNLGKIRCLEGASDATIFEGFSGIDNEEDSLRLVAALNSRIDMQNQEIVVAEMFGRMIHCFTYDIINMNTTNFVNASFDNLLWRFPTNEEFTAGFNMVENETMQPFLGSTGTNRTEYVDIMINSREMYEGLIIWVYQQSLQRFPTTEETFVLLEDFYTHKDLRLVQRAVMVTDEYANF